MPRTKAWREVGLYVHSYDSSTTIVKHMLKHCMNGRNWGVSFIKVAISYGRCHETRDLEVSNLFWNIEWVPNGAKIVGYNRSTRLKWLQREHGKSLTTTCGQKIYAKNRISYTETFYGISWKDSFRIIKWHWSYYFLGLHQMDVGAISPNRDLYKKVYIHDITKWFLLWK